jgi:hypothetical protein
MTTITIGGSHGEMEVDPATGLILRTLYTCAAGGDHWCEECRNLGYPEVVRFDVWEWATAYPDERLGEEITSIDILDIGYWCQDGTYEPAAYDWREQFRQQQREEGSPA